MKIYRPNRLNLVILAPIIVAASQSDGCGTTEPVALSQEEVVAMIAGNPKGL